MGSVQRRFILRIFGADCLINYYSRCNKIGLDRSLKKRLKLNLVFFVKVLNRLSFASSQVVQYAETSNYDIRSEFSLVKQFILSHLSIWITLPVYSAASGIFCQTIRMITSLSLFVRFIGAYTPSKNALNLLAFVSVSCYTNDIMKTLNVYPFLLQDTLS